MSSYFNIFFSFSFFIHVLTIPSPIKINSFTPFYIDSNEILLEFEYTSEIKTDIICIFKPYLNKIIFGKMFLSTDISKLQDLKENETIYKKEFFYDKINTIIINSSDVFNIGKGNYYFYLVGNLDCSIEIFLANEVNNLDTKENYLYPYISNHGTQKYLSFKIENINENKYANILLYDKNCSLIEIKKIGEIIKCNSNFNNLLFLEKNNEYLINYNFDVFNYIAINFQSELLQNLDVKSLSFYSLGNSLFNFSLSIKDYKINDHFGFLIDYPLKILLEGNFSENNNLEQFNANIKTVVYHYYINKKEINIYNYFIFKLQFFTNYFYKINLQKLDVIHFIKQLPFTYNIKKNRTYLFLFSEELLDFYRNYKSKLKFSFNHENMMNIIPKDKNKIFKNRIYVSDLDKIDAISFIKAEKEGEFKILMLPINYNQLINSDYFILGSEETFLYSSNIGEKIEVLPYSNRNIIFCNLIAGNIDIYEISDINEKKEDNNTNFNGIKELKNQTLILKFKINTFSLYEIFYQRYDKNHHFIGKNSKMIYFSKYVKYSILTLYIDLKIGIKLINLNNELTFVYNKTKNVLNSKNPFIEIENIDVIEIEGNNSLVYFLIPITNNLNYSVSDLQTNKLNEVNEIFIIPNITNYDKINLILTITESNEEEIILDYFIDFNIIPYSRNTLDLMNKIKLKRGKTESIFINNYLKNYNATHLNNEHFFIYLSFEGNVSFEYELKYSNYKILDENTNILIPSGQNKIYLGYEKNNYLKFDKCGSQQIYMDLYQNEEISRSNIEISDNDLISCTKNRYDERGYLSVDINSEEDFLISFSHDNYSSFDNIIYNYDIELSMDKYKYNVIANYYPISNYPQVEYHIYITDKKYFENLTNHCFINKNINEIYIKKYIILSNGEEEIFNSYLNITDEIDCNNTYSFLILAKEIINEYPNYHYYNPKNYYVECKIEGVIEETDLVTTNLGTIENTNDDNNDGEIKPFDINSIFLLGYDKYEYDINMKKIAFNCYFYKLKEVTFPNEIYMLININYKTLRTLQKREKINNEENKSKCTLSSTNIKNQVKYKCEFITNGNEILNIKSLDKIEINSQKNELKKLSFLHLLNKDNLQNVKGDIFNKQIFFLENSIVNNNNKEFNITGTLNEGQFNNYNQLLLQFHSIDKNNKNEIRNSNCRIIKLNNNKFLLNCIPDNPIIINILDGYSDLGDSHLFIDFKNKENLILMNNQDTNKESGNKNKDSSSSTGVIIVIVVTIAVIIIFAIIITIFICREKKNNIQNESSIGHL